MRPHARRLRSGGAALALMAGLPAMYLAATPSPAAASPAPITIAYITSITGPGASEDATSPGAFKARIALQNAEGGVHGHKLVPLIIDDQTSPSEIATAVQDADAKAFGIVSQSPLFFLAAKYPQEAGVPVTGSYSDGPEWGTQPYTNMFASDVGSVDPKYPVNTLAGNFLKQHGATTLGAYGYSISPSSSRAAIQTTDAFEHAGGKSGVLDTSVTFGSVDFTNEALEAKQAHVDAVTPEMDNNSNFALAEALAQAGVKLKVGLFATGYQPDVIHSAAWSALQGDYFYSLFRPWSLPDAATRQMQAAMEKYDHYSKSDFPSFSEYEAWLGADLMIKGLQLAGANPTRAGVIHALRGIKSYNANGLLPQSINFSTIFGHDLPKQCAWMMRATKTGFVPASTKPFCGTDIAGTDTANAG
ncbi:MAG TPA: ABC transporter substrate-binding protein [Acidimicrobiales bacterium]|nr:ABC transporter substrate-binding protein [Acidimicrobiales bacterium]